MRTLWPGIMLIKSMSMSRADLFSKILHAPISQGMMLLSCQVDDAKKVVDIFIVRYGKMLFDLVGSKTFTNRI